MAILVVGDGEAGRVCADEWAGVLRREDVRATEKEKVVIGESFRVGDVVRGVVVCRLILNDIFGSLGRCRGVSNHLRMSEMATQRV